MVSLIFALKKSFVESFGHEKEVYDVPIWVLLEISENFLP